jgi:uncharacterized protein YbjT (DUF2867 family)
MKNILVIGATGHLGPHLVKEFVNQGDRVSVLVRKESIAQAEKVDPLKALGVNLIEGDLTFKSSLHKACVGQDIVVSAVGGGQIMLQTDLADAAMGAGVNRFIPSEFGIDPIASGRGSCDLFDAKAMVQGHLKKIGMHATMIYTNGFMEFWVTGLGQLGPMAPPEEVQLFGTGKVASSFVSLPDIARYTHAIIQDPTTEGKEVRITPNIASQEELIEQWEKISGKKVKRIPVSGQELDQIIDASNTPETLMQRIFTQLHREIWIRGNSIKKRPEVLEATELYPQIQCLAINDFFAHFAKKEMMPS